MITSKDNQQLKTIRKLLSKRRDGLFVAEGEDLVEAAAAHGWESVILLRAGVDVEAELMPSALGSGSRVVGVYEERWSEPGGDLAVYLHGVHDPGNVGTVVRSTHALADGPVILGPDCADPYGPKAVRASMGSIFARPPAKASFAELSGTTVGLERDRGGPLSGGGVGGGGGGGAPGGGGGGGGPLGLCGGGGGRGPGGGGPGGGAPPPPPPP